MLRSNSIGNGHQRRYTVQGGKYHAEASAWSNSRTRGDKNNRQGKGANNAAEPDDTNRPTKASRSDQDTVGRSSRRSDDDDQSQAQAQMRSVNSTAGQHSISSHSRSENVSERSAWRCSHQARQKHRSKATDMQRRKNYDSSSTNHHSSRNTQHDRTITSQLQPNSRHRTPHQVRRRKHS